MADFSWIDVLLRGSFEARMPELSLNRGTGSPFRGSGRIVWNVETGMRVFAETDGARELIEEFPLGFTPGKLIPTDTYLHVDGQTQDGWRLKTEPVPTDEYIVNASSPHVLWDFSVDRMRLTRAFRRPVNISGRVIRALLGPPPKRW